MNEDAQSTARPAARHAPPPSPARPKNHRLPRCPEKTPCRTREQAGARARGGARPLTDMYGLGATEYYWLTGQPPLPE